MKQTKTIPKVKMSKQTAVIWFNQQLVERQNGNGDRRSWDEILREALVMEREQIQDAFYHGVDIDAFNVNNKWTEAEKYYGEKFGGKDEK
jgi:hypothetical protein